MPRILTREMMCEFGQAHARERAFDTFAALMPRNAIKPCRQQQALKTRQRTVRREQLRRVADAAPDFGWPKTDIKAGDPEVGGNKVVNILISVLLPAPFGPIRPKISSLT